MEHRHFGKSRPRHSMLQPLLGDRKKMKIFEKCGVDKKNQKLQNLGAPCGGRGVSLGGRMRSQPELPSFHREGFSLFAGGLELIRHQIAALERWKLWPWNTGTSTKVTYKTKKPLKWHY